MYLALLKLFWLVRESVDWVRIHALRYFGHDIVQSGYGNKGERAGKLPLSDWRYAVSVVFALIEAVVRMFWQVFRWLFFFNTRSIAEFFLSGVKFVLVLAVLSVAGLYGYLSGDPDPQMLARYQQLHQQHTATALLDSQGRLVGAMPNPQRQDSSVGSLSIELVPPVYWDVLDHQTGRQLRWDYQNTGISDLLFWRQRHYKGIATTDVVASLNPFSQPNNSLIKQLSNALQVQGNADERCFGWFSDFCNTLSAVRLAKHAFPYLARNNGSEFKRWTAMHNALRGEADDVYGLRAVAETVFNKRPEQLSNAEQALLAMAQLERHAVLDLENWDDLKANADEVSLTLYARDQNNLAIEISKDLQRIREPQSARLESNSPQSPTEILKRRNLRKRSELALGDFESLIYSRLSDEYAESNGTKLISDAQISLPVADNLQFQARLLSRLKEFQRRCTSCGIRKTLGEQPENSGAHIQVIVADQAGQLVRYFKRGDVQDRAIGVLSTIPASVLLASKGNKPESLFCNQTYRNLPSSVEGFPRGLINCDTPNESGHTASFLDSTELRASLPLFNAVRKQASPEELQSLYRNFSLKDLRSREGKASHAEQLAYEMSYGVVQSNPMQMLELIHQLSEVLHGVGDPKALQSISQFLVTDMEQSRRYLEFSETPSTIRLNGNYLRTQAAKETMKQLLTHELNNRDGSLKELLRLRNIRFLSTKSGQSYTKQQALRDQWLIASVVIRGKRYSISAFVGSAVDDQAGLADRLKAAEMFFPIMAEIIDSLD
ncbi:hypothetical protein [Leucothrix pacifica]|uniref:Uncharacterized protein n=1 Tax=Leucothrix pacifica TaxID=1247513 RepID=A0A317C9Q8_9GAMM|nr:hypothetical protein [Leucothrix pacifica]PWQ92792.1 hypothetical protein DKW60_19480 [Leucothrix pacifica]